MSRYRAIEEGVPVIRAASNGISAIIDPFGRYRASVTPEISQFIDGKLPKPVKNTRFSGKIALFLSLINLIISLSCVAVLRRSRETL